MSQAEVVAYPHISLSALSHAGEDCAADKVSDLKPVQEFSKNNITMKMSMLVMGFNEHRAPLVTTIGLSNLNDGVWCKPHDHLRLV